MKGVLLKAKIISLNDYKNDNEIAIPIEITDLRSRDGLIIAMVQLKSGNYGLAVFNLKQKKWVKIDMNIGQFAHPKNGLSSYDSDAIRSIKEKMTQEMVHNEIYFKYFK